MPETDFYITKVFIIYLVLGVRETVVLTVELLPTRW